MARKTQPVYDLVAEVLRSISRPYSEDITDEVCIAIERNPRHLNLYNELVSYLRKWVVNNWIGVYTRQITGRHRGRQCRSQSSLIKSYSKLIP